MLDKKKLSFYRLLCQIDSYELSYQFVNQLTLPDIKLTLLISETRVIQVVDCDKWTLLCLFIVSVVKLLNFFLKNVNLTFL